MNNDDWYLNVGGVLGFLVGILVFIGSWIYCMSTYGFLFGFGLGWLPAMILAFIVAVVVRFLWGFVIIGAILLAVSAYLPSRLTRGPEDNSPLSETTFSSPAPVSTSQWFEPLPPGSSLEWEADKSPDTIYRQVGPLSLTISKLVDGDLAAPLINVQNDQASVQIKGEMVAQTFTHRISSVVLAKGHPPVVMLQSFTGGAHCCNHVTLTGLFDKKLRTVDLGSWDGDKFGLPSDVSGDGITDFMFRDDNFLYAFASYAESWAPPEILDVVKGKVIDVSSQPAFRQFFLNDMNEAGAECRKGENGACAAYVADAARVGELDQAWAQMLGHYDSSAAWDWPGKCLVQTSGICPPGDEVRFANYPEALLNFLKDGGYISKDWVPPQAP